MPQVSYTLTRKNVKHINLRVRRDGSVAVSAPYRIGRSQIDEFVTRKQPWIQSVLRRLQQVQQHPSPDLSKITTKMCQTRFAPILQDTLAQMGQQRPVVLRIRTCTSRWGSCQPQKRTIMLNRTLYTVPLRLLEYVVLHECVHLVIPDHQEKFHTLMRHYMPDYALRRKELRHLPIGTEGDS